MYLHDATKVGTAYIVRSIKHGWEVQWSAQSLLWDIEPLWNDTTLFENTHWMRGIKDSD